MHAPRVPVACTEPPPPWPPRLAPGPARRVTSAPRAPCPQLQPCAHLGGGVGRVQLCVRSVLRDSLARSPPRVPRSAHAQQGGTVCRDRVAVHHVQRVPLATQLLRQLTCAAAYASRATTALRAPCPRPRSLVCRGDGVPRARPRARACVQQDTHALPPPPMEPVSCVLQGGGPHLVLACAPSARLACTGRSQA